VARFDGHAADSGPRPASCDNPAPALPLPGTIGVPLLHLTLPYPLENALFQWEQGIELLRRLEREGQLRGDAVTVPVRVELRRRLGATFSAAELADLYGAGTDWALQLPGVDPALPDLQELVDAAFWQHLQAASDFAGGRRIDLG